MASADMELDSISATVNSFKPLTIVEKSCILDVSGDLGMSLYCKDKKIENYILRIKINNTF